MTKQTRRSITHILMLVEEGGPCRVVRAEAEFVFLEHPSGRTVRIRPGDNWVRYRFGVYETARIRLRAGDSIRWTANDKRNGLMNGGEAVVLGIDSRRVRFDLARGNELSLSPDDRQLRHIDHAWSSTVHAAQGMTRDAAIGVLDTLQLAIADPRRQAAPAGGQIVETGVQRILEGGCIRAAWSDPGLRELEVARQRSVPSEVCRLACPKPVEGEELHPARHVRQTRALAAVGTGAAGAAGAFSGRRSGSPTLKAADVAARR